MISILRTQAESHFTAIEKAEQKALGEWEEMALKNSKKTAHLKALRLAKEEADLADSPPKKIGTKKRAATRISS